MNVDFFLDSFLGVVALFAAYCCPFEKHVLCGCSFLYSFNSLDLYGSVCGHRFLNRPTMLSCERHCVVSMKSTCVGDLDNGGLWALCTYGKRGEMRNWIQNRRISKGTAGAVKLSFLSGSKPQYVTADSWNCRFFVILKEGIVRMTYCIYTTIGYKVSEQG